MQHPEGPQAFSREGRPTRTGGFQKKLPKKLEELEESHPEAKVELVGSRPAPSGLKADHPQGMEPQRRKTSGEGPPTLRVDLSLRLRASSYRRGPLADPTHG